MRYFLLLSTMYLLIFLFFISCLSFVLNNRLVHKEYYIVNTDVRTIILGHSHAECGYNDSLISNSFNLAQSGESYFYTFLKLRKILKENPLIKNVVLEVSNNNFGAEMDDWTFNDKYLRYRYPKYSHLMNWHEKATLLLNSPFSFIDVQTVTLKDKIDFFRSHKQLVYADMDWGRFRSFDKSYIDSFLVVRQNQKQPVIPNKNVELISSFNLRYLHKIVDLCLQNQRQIIFVRSPVHNNYTPPVSDSTYFQFLNANYADVPFFDLNREKMDNNEFLDFEHVNAKGARKISFKIDSLIYELSTQ